MPALTPEQDVALKALVKPASAGAMTAEKRLLLLNGIASLLNKLCLENDSNTPDFILAEHMVRSLEAFTHTSDAREAWYGTMLTIGGAVDVETGAVLTCSVDAACKALHKEPGDDGT